jgi:hypothetical protein
MDEEETKAIKKGMKELYTKNMADTQINSHVNSEGQEKPYILQNSIKLKEKGKIDKLERQNSRNS